MASATPPAWAAAGRPRAPSSSSRRSERRGGGRRASAGARRILPLHGPSHRASDVAQVARTSANGEDCLDMGGSIRTNAAAAMLGVSPNTPRSGERGFGSPEPKRPAGGHRQFALAEIEALRAAFEETQNISPAVSVARERGTGPASPARLQ